MAVLINFKICDNAKECNGIAVCKTGALSWDEKKNTIKIDNSKCVSCGACEKACMIQAIKVARNDKEYAKLKKEIDNDPRSFFDLFVDRYGAMSVHPGFMAYEDKFDVEFIKTNKPVVVEIFNNDSIKCLLHSIPVKKLLEGKSKIKYRKLEIKSDRLLKKYKIAELPALLIFNQGKLIGKIEGYYDVGKQRALKEKIDKILGKIKPV
ncbi:MAG: 4Fe-4S binding protein [Candidatus Pacebacteria bacterium]|jgi:Fe-S-cluster-containing dehydrogenase component|nr:4Fe-4S binding protein [Candidatus Paceibacterota bacterium]